MSKSPYIDLKEEFGRCAQNAYFPDFDVYLALFDKGSDAGDGDRYSLIWKSRYPLKEGATWDVEDSGQNFKSLKEKFHSICNYLEPTAYGILDRVIHEDPQRQLEYDWEDHDLIQWNRDITLKEARQIISKISKDFRMERPVVTYDENCVDEATLCPQSQYDSADHRVILSVLDLQHCLHETVHAVVSKCEEHGDSLRGHGPTFVYQAIDIYANYGGMPLDNLLKTAQKRGLMGDLRFQTPAGDGLYAYFR